MMTRAELEEFLRSLEGDDDEAQEAALTMVALDHETGHREG